MSEQETRAWRGIEAVGAALVAAAAAALMSADEGHRTGCRYDVEEVAEVLPGVVSRLKSAQGAAL